MAYVLLVITHVYMGDAVSMQEFSDRTACEQAAAWLKVEGGGGTRTACMPKAIEVKAD